MIKDGDSEPVGRAVVTVYQPMVSGGARQLYSLGQTSTNVAGEYRIAGLPTGNYYVLATARPWFATPLIQLQRLQDQIAGGAAPLQVAARRQ